MHRPRPGAGGRPHGAHRRPSAAAGRNGGLAAAHRAGRGGWPTGRRWAAQRRDAERQPWPICGRAAAFGPADRPPRPRSGGGQQAQRPALRAGQVWQPLGALPSDDAAGGAGRGRGAVAGAPPGRRHQRHHGAGPPAAGRTAAQRRFRRPPGGESLSGPGGGRPRRPLQCRRPHRPRQGHPARSRSGRQTRPDLAAASPHGAGGRPRCSPGPRSGAARRRPAAAGRRDHGHCLGLDLAGDARPGRRPCAAGEPPAQAGRRPRPAASWWRRGRAAAAPIRSAFTSRRWAAPSSATASTAGHGAHRRAPVASASRRWARPMLHACRLALRHPRDGAPMQWAAPLPVDFLSCAAAFGLRLPAATSAAMEP